MCTQRDHENTVGKGKTKRKEKVYLSLPPTTQAPLGVVLADLRKQNEDKKSMKVKLWILS